MNILKGVKGIKAILKKIIMCWYPLICMVFGQMSKRESLSELAIVLQSQSSKGCHPAIGTTISKSNLSRANENRRWRFNA
jgi:hypothetical protein